MDSRKSLKITKTPRRLRESLLGLAFLFLMFPSAPVLAQTTYCSPNSLPRTCGGSQVCTINGDCGFLQSFSCCNSSLGFPTNTPIPAATAIPVPTNLPTFPPPRTPTPTVYVGTLNPWHTQNLSASGEYIEKTLPDTTGQYLYLVGKSNGGENGGGWTDSGLGFVRKVRIADKSVQWTKIIGQYLGYSVGAIHDAREDGSGLYVSGYTEWGSKTYVAKLNASTGAVVWEKSDVVAPTTAWSTLRGTAIDADNTYVYVGGSEVATGTGQTEKWAVHRKRKTDGVTDRTRVVDLTQGRDAVKDLELTGAYIIAVGEKNGSWYMEKITKNNLSSAQSVTGVAGSPSLNSLTIDGNYFYVAGHQSTPDNRGRLYIEKRNISDLSLVWSYLAPDTGVFQTNAHPAVFNGEPVVAANERLLEGAWADARFLFLDAQTGSPTKNVLYAGVGFVGGLNVGLSGQLFLSGSTPQYAEGAIFLGNELTYTPTPTPTVPTFAGCNVANWTNTFNVAINGNTLTGTTYTDWNFDNGADSTTTAKEGESIGGYAEIPPTNPNYGAMWGISAVSSNESWIDYSWYAPYYSGNEIYISLPGRAMISMGVANPGDRFGVQLENNTMIFTKLPAGASSWETKYIFSDLSPNVITESTHFRARVAGYSTVYRAYVGTSCKMVTLPTPTLVPTGPVGGQVNPWYAADLSTYPEFGTNVAPDSTGQYVYLVGRKTVGSPFGWHQSSTGFLQKIRKSDKQVVWSFTNGSSNSSGLFDVEEDGEYVYITGYTWWGTNLYTAKILSATGQKVWEVEDYIGWSWFPYKGVGFGMDTNYIYVASNSTNNDFDTNFSIVKKLKTTGATVAERSVDFSNDWDAVTSVAVAGGSVYVSGYKNYATPQWYIEKLNATDLSLQTSVTSVPGIIDMHGMIVDGGYLYISGFELTQGNTMLSSNLRTRIHVEKRRLSDLSSIWAFGFPLDHLWQGSTSVVIHNGEVLATANDTMDRVGWFKSSWVGLNLRFVRINKDSGNMIDTMAYSGAGNLGGLMRDITGDVLLSGSTTGRAQTAIFRINDLINQTAPFGLTVSQRILTTNPVRGGPIDLKVDIENDPDATQAAWAFSFTDQVPTYIIGVVWDCAVESTGISTGDMRAFPTRCGVTSSGAGNTISFSHSSQADPLIHPGGRLSITMRGVLAPNAPASFTNIASISSYPGWQENHYYSVNFMTSPTNYSTLPDGNPLDNTSTLSIVVPQAPTSTPGPQTPTPSPTAFPTQTPTPPIPFISSCINQAEILRTYINSQEQYYCEDNDPTGHNLIVVSEGYVKKLNSTLTKVENVRFVHKPSINGQELVTIVFNLKARSAFASPAGREYSMTVRLR